MVHLRQKRQGNCCVLNVCIGPFRVKVQAFHRTELSVYSLLKPCQCCPQAGRCYYEITEDGCESDGYPTRNDYDLCVEISLLLLSVSFAFSPHTVSHCWIVLQQQQQKGTTSSVPVRRAMVVKVLVNCKFLVLLSLRCVKCDCLLYLVFV